MVHKRFYLGLSDTGTIYMNQSRLMDEGGFTADNYAVSDLTWDGAHYKITLVHRVSTQNDPRIRVTAYAVPYPGLSAFMGFTVGAVYTTDPTPYDRPYIHFNNNVGFGTKAPDQQLDVRGNIAMGRRAQAGLSRFIGLTSPTGVFSGVDGTGTTGMIINQAGTGDTSLQFKTGQWGAGEQIGMTLDRNGNLGIGTTVPPYKLSVKGVVGAGEIVVTNTGGWADYVFEPGYRLMPLSEVASFIEKNHHLPEIPSAAEVAKSGVSVGEMQAKLLAKVEELTLHLIEAEKQIRELQSRAGQSTLVPREKL